jgi:hypothetical protein
VFEIDIYPMEYQMIQNIDVEGQIRKLNIQVLQEIGQQKRDDDFEIQIVMQNVN